MQMQKFTAKYGGKLLKAALPPVRADFAVAGSKVESVAALVYIVAPPKRLFAGTALSLAPELASTDMT